MAKKMMSLNTNNLLILSMYLVCVTTTESNSVTLKVRGVDCADTCFYNKDKNECYSSIKVNEQEKSLQEDGLNVAVIDTSSGNVEQKHFSSLFELFSYRRKKKFLNFFKNINESSIVVIASQDMCALYYSGWYKLLTKNTNIFKKNAWRKGAQVGLSIGCQGDCPVLLNGSLPYSYFGFEASHEITLVFQLKRTVLQNTEKPIVVIEPSTIQSKTTLIIGAVTGVIILLLVVFLILLLSKLKNRKKMCKSICQKYKPPRSENNNEDSQPPAGSDAMCNNVTYETVQANLLVITSANQGEPRYSGLYAGYENTRNEYQCLKQDSVRYEKIPAIKESSEYAYADPAQNIPMVAENLYYKPGNQFDNRKRCETALTYLSASPGSSHQLFKNSMENIPEVDISNENFASYVKFSKGPLYKCPSNVQKFKAPCVKPQNAERASYIDMKTSDVYQNAPSVYQTLTVTEDTEDMYETLDRSKLHNKHMRKL